MAGQCSADPLLGQPPAVVGGCVEVADPPVERVVDHSGCGVVGDASILVAESCTAEANSRNPQASLSEDGVLYCHWSRRLAGTTAMDAAIGGACSIATVWFRSVCLWIRVAAVLMWASIASSAASASPLAIASAI